MVEKMVWAYMGEDLRHISRKDREMLANLRATGKFSSHELREFNKSLVAHQYVEQVLDHAVALHKQDNSKSVKEWYVFLLDTEGNANAPKAKAFTFPESVRS